MQHHGMLITGPMNIYNASICTGTLMFTLFDNKQNVKKTTRAWHKFCVKKYNNYLNCKILTTDGSYGDVDEVFLNEEHGYLLRTNYKLPGVTH